MNLLIDPKRVLFTRNAMIYGHFLEHFHRQIYGGVYDPGSRFADEDGFRSDVLEALREIRTPVIRWPGGCFVSAYHWKQGVGARRTPSFDKAWRVEEPNAFGTDEFVKLCRKIGCEPYICANAGTGTAEEMSDWLEYCNLPGEGEFARLRAENGSPAPFNVTYWSIGNENYGGWEIGSKSSREWAALVTEAAKMMKRVDPAVKLSAAALVDIDWNTRLLQSCGDRLDMISLHGYWDMPTPQNGLSSYARCMAYTADIEGPIDRTEGLLRAFGLEKRIRIAFDEWNLRGWYHPNVHTLEQAVAKADYLLPRDRNDDNATYTMADAVFAACFLNAMLRRGDIVCMANFAPAVNTRGAIFTHPDGVVRRTTFHVFAMYTALMGDEVVDCWEREPIGYAVPGASGEVRVKCVDVVATRDGATGAVAVALVNKHETDAQTVRVSLPMRDDATLTTLCGRFADDYNDIGRDAVKPFDNARAIAARDAGGVTLRLPAHSVNVLRVPCRA